MAERLGAERELCLQTTTRWAEEDLDARGGINDDGRRLRREEDLDARGGINDDGRRLRRNVRAPP